MTIFKRKGMALPVVLIFIFGTLSLVMFIAALHKHDKNNLVMAREHYRAQFLAKGMIQLALLKARMLPQEFRDATTLYDGYGTIECMSHTNGSLPTDQTYLGRREDGELDNSVTPKKWRVKGDFLEELYMYMAPEWSESWSNTGGLQTKGPFPGTAYVTEMKLLTRRQGTRSDAIRIKVWAQEESGFSVGEISGGTSQTPINEGIKIEEVHEIILK